jgi:hypothetical protein
MISKTYSGVKWHLQSQSTILAMALAALTFSSSIAMWKLQNEFRVLRTPCALVGGDRSLRNQQQLGCKVPQHADKVIPTTSSFIQISSSIKAPTSSCGGPDPADVT